MVPPIELKSVTKRFGGFTAVDDISFRTEPGEIVGYLGPNGAGKSTSLRMALGILAPDEGEVRLFGETPNLKSLHRVGFLPEERGLYRKMSPVAIITYFARLKGMKARDARKRAIELLDRMGLGSFAHKRVSKLSKGMAQKVQILSTLAHSPDLLILDEPFSGLDPVNQADLEELIREQNADGKSIVFSTHVMEHAERLCDRIVMIARGRKLFDGTLAEAIRNHGGGARIAVSNAFDLGGVLGPKGYQAHREAAEADHSGPDWWRVELAAGQDAQHALRAAIEGGAPIMGFSPEEARLRDVFVSLVSEAESRGELIDA